MVAMVAGAHAMIGYQSEERAHRNVCGIAVKSGRRRRVCVVGQNRP